MTENFTLEESSKGLVRVYESGTRVLIDNELEGIMQDMGIELTAPNILLCKETCALHPKEDKAGAILRYTDLVKIGKSPEQLMKDFNEQGFLVLPSRLEAAKIAATLPNKNLAELMDNTEKIQKWLSQ